MSVAASRTEAAYRCRPIRNAAACAPAAVRRASSLSDLGDAQQFPNRVRLEVDASADWGFRRGWMIA
jgi:hypothetical protein